MRYLKKAIPLCLLALILVIGITLTTPKPQAATYGDLTYSVSNGEVTIIGCAANISGSLTIPETIDGYPVTAISSGVFWRRSMTSVTIPDTVRTIGSGAFDYCINLGIVNMGSGVVSIESNAFRDCYGISVYYNGTQEMWDKINIASGNEAILNANIHFPEHFDHPACGAVCEHEQAHEELAASKWTGGSLYSGDYYLSEDLYLSEYITVSNAVRLCLNGHTLTFPAGYGITVEDGGSLELCDCRGTGAFVRDIGTATGDSSILGNHGTMTIYSGNYCLDGEGVGVYNDGTIEIYGGTFGISLHNSKTATIYQANFDTRQQISSEAIYNSSGSTLVIHDCTVISYMEALRNFGTATIYGGTYHTVNDDTFGSECIYNKGRMEIYDATISAVKGDGIFNEYDSSSSSNGYLSFRGGTVTANAEYQAAIYNRKTLIVSGGTLTGYMGIYNGSALAGTTSNGGTCTVSGGTISGSFSGIHNSGSTYTHYVNGVGTKKWSKAILTINGAPTIDKILLDYPESINFNYTGTTPIALEIDPEDFAVGGTVWSYNPAKILLVDLVNDGYVLQYDYSKVIFSTDYCGADGDNLHWDLTKDGVLTISGTGNMEDFGFSSAQPWNKAKTQIDIKQVNILPGVTSIGSAAFSYISGLTQIDIPEGVTFISSWAFEGCEALEEIRLPVSLKTVSRNIFAGCTTAPETVSYAGCVHQWNQVEVGSQSPDFTPVCVSNTNTDDGDCTTPVLCSVCGGIDVAARENHTGGTATCTELAKCELCGTSYGDYGHIFDQETASEDYLKEAATCTEGAYYFKYCICGAVAENEVFQGEALGHTDENSDHICDRACGKLDMNMDQHLDSSSDVDHVCDYGCGAVLETCFDKINDGDHSCDICGELDVSEHSGNQADCENDSVCTECGAVIVYALGHSYKAAFAWNESHTACDATVTCSRQCEAEAVVECTVSAERTEPAVTVHTATAQYDGETFSNSLVCDNYLVTFVNWDGIQLQAEYYHPGETVTAPAEPVRAADVQYTYSFIGWDRPVTECTEDAVYTACYYPVDITYIVKFVDWDGTLISSDVCHYGELASVPADPARPADDTYTYTFTGWDQDPICLGDMVITATYESIYIDYTVVFQYEDGTVISEKNYHYGDKIEIPADPELENHQFAGWDQEVSAVCLGSIVYTAQFDIAMMPGDFTGDGKTDNDDVVYLLWHTLFPEQYSITADADFTGDGKADNDDVVYLLWHTLFPEQYPLKTKEEL